MLDISNQIDNKLRNHSKTYFKKMLNSTFQNSNFSIRSDLNLKRSVLNLKRFLK